ncbi:MAG: hypothetical protein QMD21_00225 [Candidatus Thermoplasmatota archaeon]|nr:hypothetical protein [Candidatus Thermoplasmatota archaeon]
MKKFLMFSGIVLFLSVSIMSLESSQFSVIIAQVERDDINITSNTTIHLYTRDWVENNTSLSVEGRLFEVPGYNGVGGATLNISWNNTKLSELVTVLSSDPALNGTFNFSFIPKERAGCYPLNVSFEGDTYRNSSWNETKIKVMHQVVINVVESTTSVVVGNNISISGELEDDDGTALVNETVELLLDNVSKNDTKTLSQGYFRINYTVPLITTAGNHIIRVFHPRSVYWLEKSAELNVTVQRKTQILLNSKVVGRNKTADVTGTLVDNMNVTLADENVTVRWWDNSEKNATTNEFGNFSVEFYVGAPPSNTINVTANFSGSNYYESSSNNTTYTVQRGANIILEGKRAVRRYTTEIKGRVFDDDGEDMHNANISLFWNEEQIGSNITNSTGWFSYTYLVPSDHFLGNVTVKAVFEENETFARSEAIVNYTITSETRIELRLEPSRAIRNSTVDIACSIFADNGMMISDEELTIRIFWNDSLINTTTTSVGKFSFAWLVESSQSLGNVKIRAELNQSSKYESNHTEVYYEIYSETYIQVAGKRSIRNATVEISGSIVDDQYVPLEVDLEIHWNTTTITAHSNSSGFFSCLYHIPYNHSVGKVNVTVKFSGADFYNSSEATAIYTIYSNTTLVLAKAEKIYKNSTVEINGTLLDDQCSIVANQLISIFWRDRQIGAAVTNFSGFSFYYNIPALDAVGEAKVSAKFSGTDIYEPSENITYYKIYSNTTILVFMPELLVRYENFTIEALLLETDSLLPIARKYMLLSIANHSLGNACTDINGIANFTGILTGSISLGCQIIKIEFNGSGYYESSKFEESIAVKERVKIAIDTLPAIEAGCELKCLLSLNPRLSNANIKLKLRLVDEELENITIVLKIGNRVDELLTNETGMAERILQADSKGNLSFSLIVPTFTGTLTLEGITEFAGTEYYDYYIPSSIVCNVSVYERKLYAIPTWLYLLPLLALPIPFVGYCILRKRQIAKMRKIIESAKGELVAGSAYIKTILELYRKLCVHLKKFGFLRKSFETFREFEYAVRKALPIAEECLDKFIGIIEEVRYSHHEISSKHRDAAIANFNAVELSIKELEERMKRK